MTPEDPGAPPGPFHQLPNSEESERAVLAAVLLSPDLLAKVEARLKVEDFFLDRHQLIYRAMLDLDKAEKPIDLRMMQARLEVKGQLEDVGGLAYLTSLDLFLPDLHRVMDYVEVVRERSARRRLIKLTDLVREQCFSGGQEAVEILAAAEREIAELRALTVSAGMVHISEVVRDTLEDVDRRQRDGIVGGLMTGFTDFDRMTGGLVGLIIFAGRPGMGKTTLLDNVSVYVGRGGVVASFSLEMTGREKAAGMISAISDVPHTHMRAGELTEHQWRCVLAAAEDLSGTGIWIADQFDATLAYVRAKCRELVDAGHDLKMIGIDYVQLMTGAGKHGNRQAEIASLSRGFKMLSNELGVPIILLSQLNRDCESRPDKRPQLSDLRESGAIEQDADMVVFIYRDELYNDNPEVKGLAELIIAKHRHGPTGTVNLAFFGEVKKFSNLARPDQWQQ